MSCGRELAGQLRRQLVSDVDHDPLAPLEPLADPLRHRGSRPVVAAERTPVPDHEDRAMVPERDRHRRSPAAVPVVASGPATGPDGFQTTLAASGTSVATSRSGFVRYWFVVTAIAKP